jgi:hypothetical protein
MEKTLISEDFTSIPLLFLVPRGRDFRGLGEGDEMKTKKASIVIMVVGSWIALASGRAFAEAAHETTLPEMSFLWCDSQRLFPFSKNVAKEVKSMFGEMGVTVHWWENEEDFTSHPSPVQLMVVMLPSEPGGPGWNRNPNSMGAVVHVENEPIEFLYIFFPSVMRGVGLNPKSAKALKPGARRDLGRALGRVIAHEAIHAVIPSLDHASAGLLNDQLNHSFLQKRKVKLDPHSQEVFLSALAKKGTPSDPSFTTASLEQ